jgi:chemotaxis regulatin CheY-phosphate phosphatase CheZ
MNTNDISILLKKADELRSLFVLGQRVIPFLEEIFVFVQDIQPMLEEINQSIDENIQKMPGASEKLSKVTEANELATTEIMDTLDKMFGSTDKLHKNSNSISEYYSKIIDKPLRLLEILRRGIVTGGDLNKAVPQIDNAIAKIKSFNSNKIKPLEQENSSIIDEINNDASAIMMSLQVQDITSQQIAAVDHMLTAIQDKLSEILKHFKNTDVSSLVDLDSNRTDEDPLKTNTTKLHREIAFDPNAINSYDDNKKRQDEIDEIVDKGVDELQDVADESEEDEDDSSSNQPQNQDDIDAMFGAGFDDDADEESIVEKADEIESSEEFEDSNISNEETEFGQEEPEPEKPITNDDDLDAVQAQDDIDAMFSQIQSEDDENDDDNFKEETQSEQETQENNDEEEFDFSKFDELGDNPDPNDIDALFNRS